MQKSILLFLCAVSGTLLAGCYENDSSGPDMVDPWLRERTPLGFRVESQVGEAVITDDWRHDETGTIRFQLVTGGIADMTKVKVEEITLQYNAKASVQAGSTIDLSSGSCDIVVTAETGETRTYTVSYDPFVEPFEGVYDMDYDVNNHDESQYENGNAFALWFFGGSNDGCYCQSLMWKHWNWNGGYKPMVEDDNVLTITLTGVDSQTGDTYGTCYNDAGPDGKYADFKWNSNGGHDLKKFYRCIPEGESLLLSEISDNRSDSRSNRTYERYNLRANLDFTIFKFIEARVDLGGRIERGKRPNIATDDLFYNMARYPSNIYEIWDDAERTHYSGTSVYNSNPVASLNALGWRQTQSRVLQGNFQLVEKLDFITEGLYLREAFSFNTYTKSGYSKTRNYARYHNGERTTTDEDTSLQASGYGSDGMEDWKQGQISLGYNRTFGRHALDGAVNFHISGYNGDGYFSYKYHYANLNGRINYSYDDRYVAEFGFSYFGNDAYAKGNQWAFYPSVSAAWVLSNEAFLKDSKVVDLLKLRLSYGRSGFADSGATGVLSNYSSNGRYLFKDYYTNSYVGSFYMGSGEGVWQSSLVHMFLANAGVHAEKSSKYNVGIDAELFGKLHLSADAFIDKRTDILTLDNSMMGYYGKNYYFDNIGKMTNKGVELSAVWNDLRANWGYSINGSVSFNRNKIDYMAEVAPAYSYNAQTGRPYGTLIGLVADGFYDVDDFNADGSLKADLPQPMFGAVQPGDIKYRDLDRSGFVDQNDVTKVGKSPYPEWTYSLGAAFNYRGFDFSFLLQGIAGASFNLLDNAVQTRAFVDNGNVYPIARGAWAYYPEQGIDTRATATYPRLTTQSNENNYQLSSFWVKSRNFMRVRNIEVGYNFRHHAKFRAAGISNFRIYLNVTNPFTVSKLMSDYDLDPELLSYRYPVLKSYNIGVSLTF